MSAVHPPEGADEDGREGREFVVVIVVTACYRSAISLVYVW